jgi:hypothetical protein
LGLARERMNAVCCHDIRLPALKKGSADVLFVLFVLDDYPVDVKRNIMGEVTTVLRPSGYFFLAAYHPADQRMGAGRAAISPDAARLRVFLERPSFYRDLLTTCGLEMVEEQILRTEGIHRSVGTLRRIFFLAEARLVT